MRTAPLTDAARRVTVQHLLQPLFVSNTTLPSPPHKVWCKGTAPRAPATTGGVAPLAALLPHTCQVLRVVWHTGYRGKQQGEEGGRLLSERMVETPEEPGAPASTGLATWAAPLVHSTQREPGKLALDFGSKVIRIIRSYLEGSDAAVLALQGRSVSFTTGRKVQLWHVPR